MIPIMKLYFHDFQTQIFSFRSQPMRVSFFLKSPKEIMRKYLVLDFWLKIFFLNQFQVLLNIILFILLKYGSFLQRFICILIPSVILQHLYSKNLGKMAFQICGLLFQLFYSFLLFHPNLIVEAISHHQVL